jgi:hypothetical protein
MTAVYSADQICYLNDASQAHAVCFGILNAANLYKKTFLYQYYPQIVVETSTLQRALDSGIPMNVAVHQTPHRWQQLREMSTDHFLIGTFFEVIAKAFILSQGMLVHKIKPNAPASQEIRSMARQQKHTPVSSEEYLRLDPFDDYGDVGKNRMQYISSETLNYGWLYENQYADLLPFSDDFMTDAKVYRVLRNLIHFPLAGGSDVLDSIGPATTDAHVTITNEIEATIKPLFIRLNDKHNFRFNLPF